MSLEKSQQPPLPCQLRMVCGRIITGGTPDYYHPTEFEGQIIYFCTEYCLEAFQVDPVRFVAAHSKRANPQLRQDQNKI